MPEGTDFSEYFRNAMEDPEARELYRRVLDEEFSSLLKRLGEERGGPSDRAPEGLGVSVEEVARYAQALGLSLRLEFVDERGEVLARYALSRDEPLEPLRGREMGDVSL